MNTIPRMDDSLICRLLNVRIIGAGRLPKEDLQTIDDAIEAIKAATQPNEAEKLMDAAGLCSRCAALLTPAQRRLMIDEAGNKTDGLNQDDFADEIVLAVERHHGITQATVEKEGG